LTTVTIQIAVWDVTPCNRAHFNRRSGEPAALRSGFEPNTSQIQVLEWYCDISLLDTYCSSRATTSSSILQRILGYLTTLDYNRSDCI